MSINWILGHKSQQLPFLYENIFVYNSWNKFIALSGDTLAFINDFNNKFGSELFLLVQQLQWEQFGWWLLLNFWIPNSDSLKNLKTLNITLEGLNNKSDDSHSTVSWIYTFLMDPSLLNMSTINLHIDPSIDDWYFSLSADINAYVRKNIWKW